MFIWCAWPDFKRPCPDFSPRGNTIQALIRMSLPVVYTDRRHGFRNPVNILSPNPSEVSSKFKTVCGWHDIYRVLVRSHLEERQTFVPVDTQTSYTKTPLYDFLAVLTMSMRWEWCFSKALVVALRGVFVGGFAHARGTFHKILVSRFSSELQSQGRWLKIEGNPAKGEDWLRQWFLFNHQPPEGLGFPVHP